MTSLKQNIFANYIGQAWSGFLGLALIPVYVHLLGIESYGVIGLFATLQAILSILDMGITPIVSREMAIFAGGGSTHFQIHTLFRSLLRIYIGLSILIGFGVYLAAEFLASTWLRVENLSPLTLASAISLMGLVISLRLYENLYRATLFGLQAQVWFNVVNSLVMTLRYVGAIAVLIWIEKSIESFFIWQAICSLVALLIFRYEAKKRLGSIPENVRFSWSALRNHMGFAGYLTLNTVLAVILTHSDKLFIVGTVSIKEFAFYSMATSIAGALYMVALPISSSVYPRLVELVTQGERERLHRTYHSACQLMTVLTVPASLVVIHFSYMAVFVWSADGVLASQVSPILIPCLIGTLLNCLMYMPLQAQLAYGNAKILMQINLLFVCLFVPLLLFLVPSYGVFGAAWLWVGLNIGYFFLGIYILHNKILQGERWAWVIKDIALPSFGAIVGLLLWKYFVPIGQTRWSWFLYLFGVFLVATSGALSCSSNIRIVAFREINTFVKLNNLRKK